MKFASELEKAEQRKAKKNQNRAKSPRKSPRASPRAASPRRSPRASPRAAKSREPEPGSPAAQRRLQSRSPRSPGSGSEKQFTFGEGKSEKPIYEEHILQRQESKFFHPKGPQNEEGWHPTALSAVCFLSALVSWPFFVSIVVTVTATNILVSRTVLFGTFVVWEIFATVTNPIYTVTSFLECEASCACLWSKAFVVLGVLSGCASITIAVDGVLGLTVPFGFKVQRGHMYLLAIITLTYYLIGCSYLYQQSVPDFLGSHFVVWVLTLTPFLFIVGIGQVTRLFPMFIYSGGALIVFVMLTFGFVLLIFRHAKNEQADETKWRAFAFVSALVWWPLLTAMVMRVPVGWFTAIMLLWLCFASLVNPYYFRSTEKRADLHTLFRICGSLIGLAAMGYVLFISIRGSNLLNEVQSASQSLSVDRMVIIALVGVCLIYFFIGLYYVFYRATIMFTIAHVLVMAITFILPIVMLWSGQFYGVRTELLSIVYFLLILTAVFAFFGMLCSCSTLRRALRRKYEEDDGMKQITTPVTCSIIFGLTLGTFDFVTDVLYAFRNPFYQGHGGNIGRALQFVCFYLLAVQCVAQMWSFIMAAGRISSRTQLKFFPLLKAMVETPCPKFCCPCVYVITTLTAFFYIPFILLFFLISGLILGLTKLMSVIEIQSCWLAMLISNISDVHEERQFSMRSPRSYYESSDKGGVELQIRSVSDSTAVERQLQVDNIRRRMECIRCIDEFVTPNCCKERFHVEAGVYNTILMSELVVESLPQFVVNIIDSGLKREFSVIAAVSLSFSLFIIMWHVGKIIWHTSVKKRDVAEFLL